MSQKAAAHTKVRKVRITWNGMGGELDSVTVRFIDDGEDDNDMALTRALIRMLNGNIVHPGDSFTVEYVARGEETR
jgi:hypothetical protein